MSQPPDDRRPRSDPEIIPPTRAGTRAEQNRAIWVSVDERGTHRVYFMRLGPFGIILMALAITILVAVMLVLLLGAVLIWIPLVGLLVAAAIISAFLRGYLQRPR